MNTVHDVLSTLKHELEFLDHRGYQTLLGSRQPLFCMESETDWKLPVFFEDSPSCPKRKYDACSSDRDCVLMDFVPIRHRRETVPCHHIPLNAAGETLDSMSKLGAPEKQIETAVRSWLVKNIARLEDTTRV